MPFRGATTQIAFFLIFIIINIYMPKKYSIYTSLKRNPIAKQLRTSKFKIKIIKNKKKYNRKKIKKLFE